jgi:hypothetical protein
LYQAVNGHASYFKLLGTMPDEDVARRIGRSPNAVRLKRTRLGIKSVKDRRVKEHRAKKEDG